MTVQTAIDVPALLAENERLRAIIDRVEQLADGFDIGLGQAPPSEHGALVVVETHGGYYEVPRRERVFVRADRDAAQLAADNAKAPFVDGDWWKVGDDDIKAYPRTWGELNWLDDPPCDRGTVSMETFLPVEALREAPNGGEGR